jgi:serine/threonine-protein phosphatase 4 regulatory subunit 1
MSDYDPSVKNRAVPPLSRSISITAELDKSPKRHGSAAEVKSPLSPRLGGDADLTRVRKSPRRSPEVFPVADMTEDIAPLPPAQTEIGVNEDATAVQLVDEGDVLPNVDFQMDVTFDDEGLNTLERIFLLSKSDFPFHRAYVARVLGDLLSEVDPCESVEYVLPLLSGFSMDEDESVKEAFASELHRILWYFYSTCKLVLEEDEIAGVEYKPMSETVTITSEGVDVVPKADPELEQAPSAAYLERRRGSVLSGPSTAGSIASSMNPSSSSPGTAGSARVDTPASTVSDGTSSQGTAFSPNAPVQPYADDIDPEKGWTKDAGPLVEQPPLAVTFFTPLLGSLLLNQNPTISDSVRNGVVHLIGRLRERVEPAPEVWGTGVTSTEVDERRVFASQTGPHSHDLRPFDKASRRMVEQELLMGIVIGMGQLSVEMPEGIFAEPDDVNRELFQEQLIAEATAGRATSMNLIGSLCEFYEAHEVVEAGFIEEVLRSGDGDVAVRAEGAVALSSLAKIAPPEQVHALVGAHMVVTSSPDDRSRCSSCCSKTRPSTSSSRSVLPCHHFASGSRIPLIGATSLSERCQPWPRAVTRLGVRCWRCWARSSTCSRKIQLVRPRSCSRCIPRTWHRILGSTGIGTWLPLST